MQRKSVIFVADSLDNAHKFQAVLSGMDADVLRVRRCSSRSFCTNTPTAI